MNYIGSKQSLLKFIDEGITEVTKGKTGVFLDLFAGTGAVGIHFKKKGYQVIGNDIQYYSYVVNRHYIGNHRELKFSNLVVGIKGLAEIKPDKRKEFVCRYLSRLPGVKGYIFQNYCFGGTKSSPMPRQYFSDENGMLCDAVRIKIEKWKQDKLISDNEYYFLLTSLIESVDKIANTASVYGAFLKKLKKTAAKRLEIKPAELIINENIHKVFNADINDLIVRVRGDILYLDPPYNHRQYATNYHLLETIARYDKPAVYGKTGLRDYQKQKSKYCLKTEVKKVFKEVISKAKVRYIFVSYNNEGLMSAKEICEIMSTRGEYGCFQKIYNRYKADKSINRKYLAEKTIEYLHYVICDN